MEFSCGSVRPSCAERTTCEDCLSVRGYGCLWCTNPPTCMRADAYPARFPVGQCHNYTQDAPHICPRTWATDPCGVGGEAAPRAWLIARARAAYAVGVGGWRGVAQ